MAKGDTISSRLSKVEYGAFKPAPLADSEPLTIAADENFIAAPADPRPPSTASPFEILPCPPTEDPTNRPIFALNNSTMSHAIPMPSLEEVSSRYWQPLCDSVLRRGLSRDDAEDLTQEFFVRLIEKKWLTSYNPSRLPLLSFLLLLFKRFQTNEWHRQHRKKNGGSQTLIRLDALEPARRATLEPVDPDQPDAHYDQARAAAALDRALAHIRLEAVAHGTVDRFDLLEPTLFGEPTALPYAQLAHRWNTSVTAVKSMVYRLRHRFHEVLSVESSRT